MENNDAPIPLPPIPAKGVRVSRVIALWNACLGIADLLGIKAPARQVSEDFITQAARFHWQGRCFMLIATSSTVVIIPYLFSKPCRGGASVMILASGWTALTFFLIGGRFYKKERPNYLTLNPFKHFGAKFVKTFSKYPHPVLLFAPDVLLLTILVVHTGGTLGDYALVSWPWRRIFLLTFIFIPYFAVVFLNTDLGRSLLAFLRLDKVLHEAYWAPLETIPYSVAVFTVIVYVGATMLGSYVLRHLLHVWMAATMAAETKVSPGVGSGEI